ncbi:glycosyltransferase family 2 protein [Nocardioides piscis]|uniref:Glycosyltransferase family 2 protein n=1 Tax=Nocardioides piscis TaxID=2714938 RepID=A0A6G7YFP6_9ACTN|nr:glycosyltransferase family 2 protein [Nocardioides piscis]QIK75600.1 glycosyltransferase family 2 protein [Nocardioides piscis]
MTVTALLVSHDGARWLPTVLAGVAAQSLAPDAFVAVDTGSRDDSAALLREAWGSGAVHAVESGTTFPQAVRAGLATLPPAVSDDDWIWLLHDDSTPDPDALLALTAAMQVFPAADIFGPKLREWPSLRRLLELGLTITGTGRRETGLERGEYDQGQHDEPREVLAVNTAGMLVRRSVLEGLGGFDDELPIFGNDLDFGWRAARAGHQTVVIPQAVVFHAEAAHRGTRRTPLTGRHTHYQERRAALFTMLANASGRRLPWQVVRLFLGSILRVLGFLVVRSVGEALDELAAVLSVYSRPGHLRSARRARAEARSRAGVDQPQDVRRLLAPWWLPYRHGLDFVTDLLSAATSQAADVAERRRAARLAVADPVSNSATGGPRSTPGEDEEFFAEPGPWARWLTNPVTVIFLVFGVLAIVAARPAFGAVTGGALSPVPPEVADWWRLHIEARHPLGTGTDVPAPAYLLPFALLGTLLGANTGLVVSALMLLAVPLGAWGAWRLLTVIGHLVDTRDLPRWVHVWGAITYGLVPATSGAWGEGRFGTVAVAALLPWMVRAALGFADPEPDGRWRAAWRTALLLALGAAFVPGVWLFALLAGTVVLGASVVVAPRLLKDRSVWGPPVTSLVAVPLLLAPWLLPLVTTGSASGLLLEAGRLPGDRVDFVGLLTGRLGDAGAPWWLGALVGVLAVLALVPRSTRLPVLVCWLLALAAAVVVAALAWVRLPLPMVEVRPSLGLFVVVLQGVAVTATVIGAEAVIRHLQDARTQPAWQRLVAGLLAVVGIAVPLGGLGWWLVADDHTLTAVEASVVPAYMEQSAQLGDEHGVLVVRGSVDEGIDYRVLRGDGVTLGEDEILALADVDREFDAAVRALVSAPTSGVVKTLGDAGVEYVVLPSPADGAVAAGLDATPGLDQASAEDRSTRAWRVDRPLAAEGVESRTSVLRIVLLVVQGLAVVVVLVLAAPTVRRGRDD